MVKSYRNKSRTSKTPRRPFEKERLESELKLIGKYGLKNKREVWRVQLTLARIRKAARELLTQSEKNPRRIFEGAALMRRMFRYGLLTENENKLDYVLGLTLNKFLDRRLQTVVYKRDWPRVFTMPECSLGKDTSMGKNIVNIPSFLVRVDSEKNIDFSSSSPFGGGQPGRTKRKTLKKGKKEEEN